MKRKFSTSWKSSKKPRKQKKYRANAPLHIRKKFLSATLSKELRAKYKTRNMPIRKEDTVKVMRGKHRKKIGKVSKVDHKTLKVFVQGIEHVKRDGTKAPYPLDPSNIMITQLSLIDKKRIKKEIKKNGKETPQKTKSS